jgi:LCP family protein required for cell wall assembly
VAGVLLVVLLSAGIGGALVLGQIVKLRDAIDKSASIKIGKNTLAPAGFGDPQTFLLVGNDQRNHTTTEPVLPHSNEMLLVRIDPGKPWISMMSIPRELMVSIKCPAGTVTTRLNYALTCGGFTTLVSTIHQVTGLSVNHVVMIDFNNFKRAVDEMGCVYTTVDRRYYHVNVPGGEQYQEIDLQPGYQDLCGDGALQYVSYRHDDTSLVRDARNQSFLLDVKKQYGPSLLDNLGKFEQIFGQTVQTDAGLHSITGIDDLLGTLVGARSLRVRQVQFQVNLQSTGANPCSCDTATQQQIGASVHSFLYGGSPLPTGATAVVAHAVHAKGVKSLPLTQVPSSEVAQARTAAEGMPFPYEYPAVQDASGAFESVSLRDYLIHAPGGIPYPIYVAVFYAGQLGQYYDVQGTTWTGAPMFASPDQQVAVAGRTYNLYYDGQHLQMVAWFEHGAVYWVRNSLVDSIGNGELLAIAEQSAPVTSTAAAAAARRRVRLHAAYVPPRKPVSTDQTTTFEIVGAIGALVTIIAVPLLAVMMIRRRRELAQLRNVLDAGVDHESWLSASADAAGVPDASAAVVRSVARARTSSGTTSSQHGSAADPAAT